MVHDRSNKDQTGRILTGRACVRDASRVVVRESAKMTRHRNAAT